MPYQKPGSTLPSNPPAETSAPADADRGVDNSIVGLRAEIFGALRDLRAGKLDVDKARAVSELAQTIINSAKVEVDHAKVVGSKGATKFLAPSDDSGTRRITHT